MDYKKLIKVVLNLSGISFAILIVLSAITGVDSLKYISIAISCTNILILWFCNWGWKYANRLFYKVIKKELFIDLNGKYECNISYGENFNQHKTTEVIIKQSLLEISVTLISDERKSESHIARLVDHSSYKELVYTYATDTHLDRKNENPEQYGAARLTINEDHEIIQGQYWTDRPTMGMMELRKVK